MQTAQVSDVSPIESVKVIDFSECLDENSISPALQLSDDSVWFLSVRDETSNSIVYDLDKTRRTRFQRPSRRSHGFG